MNIAGVRPFVSPRRARWVVAAEPTRTRKGWSVRSESRN